jgi:hypothetical protein
MDARNLPRYFNIEERNCLTPYGKPIVMRMVVDYTGSIWGVSSSYKECLRRIPILIGKYETELKQRGVFPTSKGN